MERHDGGGRARSRDGGAGYAAALGSGLRDEFGDRRFAAKALMRWTGSGKRTVKAWLTGAALPNGRHLIGLMAHSDAVLAVVLAAARRVDPLDAFYALSRRQGSNRARDAGPHGTGHRTGRDPGHDARGEGADRKRQRWFLSQLTAGAWVDAASIKLEFGVSWRTAKRHIAALKGQGAIRFDGTNRNGRYSVIRRDRWAQRPHPDGLR